jgi:hypothetical protein
VRIGQKYQIISEGLKPIEHHETFKHTMAFILNEFPNVLYSIIIHQYDKMISPMYLYEKIGDGPSIIIRHKNHIEWKTLKTSCWYNDVFEIRRFTCRFLIEKMVNGLIARNRERDKPRLHASDIKELLHKRYADKRQWVCFEELRLGTCYVMDYRHKIDTHRRATEHPNSPTYNNLPDTIYNPQQSIDFYAMNMYNSNDLLKIAFEIKTSRADFLNEIKLPVKRQQAMSVSNQFYFVIPKDMAKIEEIPDDCGLMYAYNHIVKIVKQAPTRVIDDATWVFVASICRRIAKKEKED